MIPKIKVRPAASRNSSMPSWMPFRHCSITYSMVRSKTPETAPARRRTLPALHGSSASASWRVRPRAHQATASPAKQDGRSACASAVCLTDRRTRLVGHLALLPVLVLVIFDDGGDRLEP